MPSARSMVRTMLAGSAPERRHLGPPTALVLLDVHDDARVHRALEKQVRARRSAVLAHPVPGLGASALCEALMAQKGWSGRLERQWRSHPIGAQTVQALRAARVRELFVMRAHTLDAGSWNMLGRLAVQALVDLRIVVREPVVAMEKMECLTRTGLAVEREPRLLMVSHDTVALAMGLPPAETAMAPPGARVWWLPAADVPRARPASVI